MEYNFTKDVALRTIKIFDIGYIFIFYFAMAFIVATVLDKVMGDFDFGKADNKSTIILTLELFLHTWLVAIGIYIARNVMQAIPSPFNGIMGFEHSRVKEINDTSLFTATVLFFQQNFRDKVYYLQNRIKTKKALAN